MARSQRPHQRMMGNDEQLNKDEGHGQRPVLFVCFVFLEYSLCVRFLYLETG